MDLNRELAVLQIPFGFLLKGIEFRLGELHELVAAGFQGFAGQRLERFSQLYLGVIEQPPLFGKIRSLGLGVFFRGGAQLLFRLQFSSAKSSRLAATRRSVFLILQPCHPGPPRAFQAPAARRRPKNSPTPTQPQNPPRDMRWQSVFRFLS